MTSSKVIYMSNSTIGSGGRLGNQIIRNTVCSLLAKKYDLHFEYDYEAPIESLGIELYKDGKNDYSEMIKLKDDDFLRYLLYEDMGETNIYTSHTYFQNQVNADFLRAHFSSEPIKRKIIDKNSFYYRYDNNNDVYVHVRLGDAVPYCPSYDYYDKVLEKLDFKHGYISSESLDHEICQKLMIKYDLMPLNYDEVETIMFASTCKYIVLTNGIFGWFIGVFGWFSTIYYPNLDLRPKHHGDMYGFSDWIMNDYSG